MKIEYNRHDGTGRVFEDASFLVETSKPQEQINALSAMTNICGSITIRPHAGYDVVSTSVLNALISMFPEIAHVFVFESIVVFDATLHAERITFFRSTFASTVYSVVAGEQLPFFRFASGAVSCENAKFADPAVVVDIECKTFSWAIKGGVAYMTVAERTNIYFAFNAQVDDMHFRANPRSYSQDVMAYPMRQFKQLRFSIIAGDSSHKVIMTDNPAYKEHSRQQIIRVGCLYFTWGHDTDDDAVKQRLMEEGYYSEDCAELVDQIRSIAHAFFAMR